MMKTLCAYATALLFVSSSLFLTAFKTKTDEPVVSAINTSNNIPVPEAVLTESSSISSAMVLYNTIGLAEYGLSKEAFEQGVKGLSYLNKTGTINNSDIITIVDFSLPATEKRLFVIDLKNSKLLYNTYVAHGRNSGQDMANRFSNKNHSCKSSLGFYVTGDTYQGKHGYSLKLDGLERGINDNAMKRGIVMHSAWYVNEKLVQRKGYVGRSEGCPAIPKSVYKPIISNIKDGTCLFIYSPDNNYVAQSNILRQAS
jgi:hypothetical protein